MQLLACVTDSRYFMHSVVVFAYAILPAKASWSLVADRRGVRRISSGLFGNTDSEMHVILNPFGGDDLEICQPEGLKATKFLQRNAWGTWAGAPSTWRACLYELLLAGRLDPLPTYPGSESFESPSRLTNRYC